jgi:hypothetical protein
MPDPSEDDHLRLAFDRFCDRYISYWGFVCLVAFLLLGWPAIVAWVGLLMAMNAFRDAVLGNQPQGRPRRAEPKKEET